MKKIICLLGLIIVIQNGFGKEAPYGAYFNYTQNIGVGGYWFYNNSLTANNGDSIVFDAYVYFPWGPYKYPEHWYFEGDSIPNAGGQEFLSVIISQPGTYSAYLDYATGPWS